MKILFVAASFFPNIGGVEKHILELSRVLMSEGNTVTVLTPLTADQKSLETIEGIAIKRFPKNRNKVATWRTMRQYSEDISQADIIHAHDYIPFFWIYPLAKLKGKGVWVTFHGWEGRVPPARSVILLRRLAEKLAAGSICVGQFIKTWYGQHPDKIIYGGVHINASLPQINQVLPLKKFIFLGRLDHDNGFDIFIEFFILYYSCEPQAVLTIIGDGPLRNEAEKILKEGKVNYSFLGKVKDPAALISRSDVACLGGYLSILEVMAAGVIPLAIYQNLLRKDYLHLTPFAKTMIIASSAEELVNELKKITKEQISEIKKINFGLCQKFTWKNVANEYLSLWHM